MPSGLLRRGFTLVEVMVALLVMSILAALAWQGLDGILRARDGSRAALDRSQKLGTVIVQWEQDLLALHDTTAVPALSFDGRALRLTRRVEGGLALVAWSVRAQRWQRWVSPTVTRMSDIQEAWLTSQGLLGNEPGHIMLAEGVSDWQVYFHRGGNWTNAQSSGDVAVQPVAPAAPAASGAAAPVREQLPEAVRLLITLDGATLTRDIALGPTASR